MNITRKIIFDLNNEIYTRIDAKQNDIKSRYIEFTLTNNGVAVDLTGHTVKIFALKVDNTIIFNNVQITDATNGKVLVELTSQALAVVGELQCELDIYGTDNSVLSSKVFMINVLASIRNDSAIESTNEFTALTEGITKLNGWDQQFQGKYDGLNAEYASQLTSNTNKIGNLSANGITESSLSEAIKNNRTQLASHTTQLADKQTQINSLNTSIANNANAISVHTNQIQSLASGSPANVFLTLTALQSDANANTTSGKTKTYVISADGGWYYWNGSTWTRGGTYQSTGIAFNSVNEAMTTFINSYYNMYNDSSITTGYYSLSGSAIISNSGGSNLSKHAAIHLKANTTYSISRQTSGYCYLGDASMNWISTLSFSTSGGSFTTTQECYLYFTVNTSLSHSTIMIVEGSLPSTFQSYGVVYKRDISNLLNYVTQTQLSNYQPNDGSITEAKTSFVKTYYNMYNDAALVNDNYYTCPSTTIVNSSGTGTNLGNFPAIKLKANTTYSLSKYQGTYTFIGDSNGNKIAKLSDIITNGSFTTTQDCCLYLTIATNLSHNTIMLVEGTLPSTFQPYNVVYKRKIDNLTDYASAQDLQGYATGSGLVKYTEIHVKQDGTGNFTTISSAIASLTDQTVNNQVNVYIHDGVYNENISGYIPNYVNLIGYSGVRENVVINGSLPNTANDTDITNISTINLQQSNTIKNLTITARNMRYVIHSESANFYKDWTQIVDNCYLEHYGNQDVINYRIANNLDYSGVWTSPGAWIEGASSGSYAKFTRCKFVANAAGGAAWSVHNNTGFTKPMLHILEDCELVSKQYGSVRCEGLNSIQNDKVYIKNCFLDGNIYCTNALTIQCIVSGSTQVPSSTTTYFATNSSALYTEYTKHLLNNTGAVIPAGTLVCFDGDITKIRKMLNTDSANIFAGYTIGDTATGNYATVITNGYYRYTTDLTFGIQYGVDNGALSASATNKIGMSVGGGFVKVKNPMS
ncbi:BppU family phage baseplate upper protein [Clostridium sp. C8-1-8]|uniref:BppU family phage baseplate upper protein n=1 Tax=Clostridium sp. C8-1-8 TaxID=2698831 RepID=UPI0013685DE9|nr:BppU family phage baseplate upper protein [Clostridium sp. C8-1-8]